MTVSELISHLTKLEMEGLGNLHVVAFDANNPNAAFPIGGGIDRSDGGTRRYLFLGPVSLDKVGGF